MRYLSSRAISIHVGVGSGVCIQHGSTPLNLVTLYTATKAERVAQAAADDQPKINKLISPYSDSTGPELTQAVHGLCQQADAFILVINTSDFTSGEPCIPDCSKLTTCDCMCCSLFQQAEM